MLAILRDVADDCSVIVAANREEFFDRPGTPPQIWPGSPAILAGRDPRAGGTWLGVNEYQLLVAITNRAKRRVPMEPRSRGLLCLELLACRSARDAQGRAVTLLREDCYAGCNVLAVDCRETHVVQAGDSLLVSSPIDGINIVTTLGVDEPGDSRATFARRELLAISQRSLDGWLKQIVCLVGRHADGVNPPICLHGPDRGTVSSSIVALGGGTDKLRWLHAQGPPCRERFGDYSLLLRQLALPSLSPTQDRVEIRKTI